MSDLDLFSIIEDSLTDSQLPTEDQTPADDTQDDLQPEAQLEATPETQEAVAPSTPTQEATPPVQASPTPAHEAVPTAQPKVKTKLDDKEFQELVGVPPQYPGGRENRIPYSRVKKITDKATKMAVAEAQKVWESQTSPHVAKLAEFEGKTKDYESRLARVAKFEDIMSNNPSKFLEMLESNPVYNKWFQYVRQSIAKAEGHPSTQQAAPDPYGDMPQPDQALSDGSKVYSIEGLKGLLAWQTQQVEARVQKQIGERYEPIEKEWEANKRVQALIPQIRSQIDEARSWPLFNENESEIVSHLQADQRLSLEGAYRKVVFPKITADRNRMRESILAEVKQAPRATSAPSTAIKSAPAEATGPRSLEDIITEQVKNIR